MVLDIFRLRKSLFWASRLLWASLRTLSISASLIVCVVGFPTSIFALWLVVGEFFIALTPFYSLFRSTFL